MIIYNVTIKVDQSIASQWKSWMFETHIPAVMASGCFLKYQMLRIADSEEEDDPTYAVQYFAASMDDYNLYIKQYAEPLRSQSLEKWGDRFVAFRTVMEVVG